MRRLKNILQINKAEIKDLLIIAGIAIAARLIATEVTNTRIRNKALKTADLLIWVPVNEEKQFLNSILK